MTEYDSTAATLRQAVKMEAIGQLTGGVAHDFNNILMVIMGNLDALEEETNLDQEARDNVQRIGAAAQRARDLTRQLLAFSRRQALRPLPTDVNELVNGTAGCCAGRWARWSKWRRCWQAACGTPRSTGPSSNRRWSTSPSTRATPCRTAAACASSPAISRCRPVPTADGIAAGDYVVIAVSDTGKGMPPAVLDKVFEPFFTTKEVGRGTGLGLSMVYGFLQQSRGHIQIESEVDRGTTVRLYLPRSKEATEAAAASAPAAMPRGNERILVVEDDRAHAQRRGGPVEEPGIRGDGRERRDDRAGGLRSRRSCHSTCC